MRLIMPLSKEQQKREIYGEPLFYLSQFEAQNIGKLCRYFNEVLCDFGPH